jgi:hypothetical protein
MTFFPKIQISVDAVFSEIVIKIHNSGSVGWEVPVETKARYGNCLFEIFHQFDSFMIIHCNLPLCIIMMVCYQLKKSRSGIFDEVSFL